MRHRSPETKRVYQLGLVHQVREHMERANEKAYQRGEALHLRDSVSEEESAKELEACNFSKKWRALARGRFPNFSERVCGRFDAV